MEAQLSGSGKKCPLYTGLACVGGLGFLHEAAGVSDQVGYLEGLYQAGDIFLLQEAAHFRLGYGGEGE